MNPSTEAEEIQLDDNGRIPVAKPLPQPSLLLALRKLKPLDLQSNEPEQG